MASHGETAPIPAREVVLNPNLPASGKQPQRPLRKHNIPVAPKIHSVRKARALSMLAMRVRGATNIDIGKAHNCTEETVARTLKWADQQNIIQNANDALVDRLANKAIAAYEKALDAGDTVVATKVLETLGVIRKIKDQPAASAQRDGDTWEAYLLKRTRGRGTDDEAGDEFDAGDTIEGEVVPAGNEHPRLPAAAGEPGTDDQLTPGAPAVSAEGRGAADPQPFGFVPAESDDEEE